MPVKIFFCYAHEDEALLNKLKTHLRPLQRQGLIDPWHDRDISAGAEWEQEIKEQLNAAQIILLLISPDFMDSDYCYGKEMKRAIERHERGEAHVIPIILRPVYFQGSLFSKLQALPTDAKPVMSSSWHYQDEAFYNVTEGIHKVVEKLTSQPSIAPLSTQAPKEESTTEFILSTGAELPTKLPIPQSVSPSKLDSPMEQEMVHAPDTTYPADLTPGEVEVLRQLAQGLTSAQIAEQLSIGIFTVNSHVRSIYNKLRVSSRSAATRYAIEHHLL